MIATVNIPAYHANGQDFPRQQATMRFEGYPPKRLQIRVFGQDGRGKWDHGIVEVVNVLTDPGWSIGGKDAPTVMQDNLDTGYAYTEVETLWVERPGKKVTRAR